MHRWLLPVLTFMLLGGVFPGPGRVRATAPAVGVRGWQILSLGRGHFNRLRLAATVEGVKGLLILDTGAGATLLSQNKFPTLRAGPDRKPPAAVPVTVSVNGLRASVSMARDFYVGGRNLGSAPVVLVPRRYLYDQSHDSDQQYDGLLGENFLHRYRAVVDCGRLALYLNTDPSQKMNLGSGLTQAGWTRVTMLNLHGDFVVPCEINGHRFRMVVDTGEPFVKMDRGMLAGAQVSATDIPMKTGVIGTIGAIAGFVRLPNVNIGGYDVNDLQVVVDTGSSRYFQDPHEDQASGKVLGLLGGSFLAANHAIIDVGGGALYLKREAASAARP